MAKLGEISQENRDIVEQVIADTGLDNYMNFDVVATTKSKTLIKVSRANAYTEYKTKSPDLIVVAVYEAAFDRLTDEQKDILVRDAINTVGYDTEKDKVIIGCPQITVSVGGLQKWGDKLLNASECGVAAITQIEEEEKEKKEQEKALKKSKKNG